MMLLKHQKGFVLSFSALLLLLAMNCHCSSAHTQFIVGDSAGWVIPPYPTYYTNWSHNHFFRVGDSLVFNFDPKFYNLMEVSEYEYEHCTSMEPLKVFNSSPAIIQLNQNASFFFVCTIANYCCLGQKLAVSVHQRTHNNKPPSPLPSPSPSPLPSPLPSHAPPPPTPPLPPPPSASNSNGSAGNPPPSSNKTNNAVAFGTSFSVHLLPLLLLGFWMF